MNILVIGSGGREQKQRDRPQAEGEPEDGRLWCARATAASRRTRSASTSVRWTSTGVVLVRRRKNPVDLVFVAPDDPLAAGMVDALEAAGIRAFGPRANAAVIESSKVFSKNLMKKYGIPTARYEVFSDPAAAVAYIEAENRFPVVVKADGLALGKGVLIAEDLAAAKDAVHSIMEEQGVRRVRQQRRRRGIPHGPGGFRARVYGRQDAASDGLPRRTTSARWTATRA